MKSSYDCRDQIKGADVKSEGKRRWCGRWRGISAGATDGRASVHGHIATSNVRMISQGASESKMSFMIDEEDADEGGCVRCHAAFFQDPDPDIFDWKRETVLASRS